MKIALLSESLPPALTGQAVVLYRLLQCFSADEYCLISSYDWQSEKKESASPGALPGKYYALAPLVRFNKGYRWGLMDARANINIPMGVFQRARQVTEIVKREKCDALVACTGDLLDLPAGYLASRRAGIPFYFYIFDHYSYREWQSRAATQWAQRFERWLMKKAESVIVPNETLRDELRKQYGIEAVVIHNSFDISPYERSRQPDPDRTRHDNVRIVYTGDVYEAHYDAFRNLLAAIAELPGPRVQLHLYTDRTLDELAAQDIRGELVLHKARPTTEMPLIQMNADILFLPLAFKSPYPDLIRTSATSKLAEYLAAGRPVLVHAPSDSFISWYFRQHQCGIVVDQLDPTVLAREIQHLLNDEELQQRLSERAWQRARADFDITTARKTFRSLLERGIRTSSGLKYQSTAAINTSGCLM